LQYEVHFHSKPFCVGAYLKLLAVIPDAKSFHSKTRYALMFGPDKCGDQLDKIQLITKVYNPLVESWTEHHLKNAPTIIADKWTHLYTLVVKPRMRDFEIFVDNVSKRKGRFDTDFEPPLQLPTEVSDPSDTTQPEDWPEEIIEDPNDVEPEDWHWYHPNEEWEQGGMVNPEYKGKWTPRMIQNPFWFMHSQKNNIAPIKGIAIDIWTASDTVGFDNIWLGYKHADALAFSRETWKVKNHSEVPRQTREKEIAASYAQLNSILADAGLGRVRGWIVKYCPVFIIEIVPDHFWYYTPHTLFSTILVLQISMVWWCMSGTTSGITDRNDDNEDKAVVEEKLDS